jgi:hypothetical protein
MRPASAVNRLARTERGRRNKKHVGGRGKTLTPGVSLSSAEMRVRSGERTVAKWFDATDDAMAALSVRWLRGWDVPPPSFQSGPLPVPKVSHGCHMLTFEIRES